MHCLQELVRLHRLQKPARTVARLLRIGPNAERKYRLQLAAAGLPPRERWPVPEASSIYVSRAAQSDRPPAHPM